MSSRRRNALRKGAVALALGAAVLQAGVRPVQAQDAPPPLVEAPAAEPSVASTTDQTIRTTEIKAAPVANLLPPSEGMEPSAPGIMPPTHTTLDANNVNLLSGGYTLSEPINSIGGAGARGLATENLYLTGGAQRSSIGSYFQLSNDWSNVYTNLVLMGDSMTFQGNPTTGCCTPQYDAVGKWSYPDNVITYTAPDGTQATFETRTWNSSNPTPIGQITSLRYPSGEILTFTRTPGVGGVGGGTKVESSLGYALIGPDGGVFSSYTATAANLKNGSCSTTQCSGPTYASQADLGRVFLQGGGASFRNATGDKPRTYAVETVEYGDRVTSFTDGVSIWTYSYVYDIDTREPPPSLAPIDGVLTTTATDPQHNKRVVKSRVASGHVISDTVFIGGEARTTTFQYVGDEAGFLGRGKLRQITYPEGNRVYIETDGYRNVTALWRIPKGASTTLPVDQIPGTTVERASYSCRPTFAGGENCKSPDWTRDARGAQTDYAYDPDTGELLSVTQPAAPNGVRPQNRYAYGTFTARYVKDGAWATGSSVRRLVRTSTCATGAAPACLGTADEMVTDYVYEDSSQPNNVRLVAKTVRAGDNSLSATTRYAYNDRGDLISTDGPLPGTADTTTAYYDASRWTVGEASPDPDGAGPLLPRAGKTAYRADGQVAERRTGVVADPSPATFDNAFQTLNRAMVEYDGQARVARETSFGTDGAAFAQTENAYDIFGRPSCSAVRMNPALFGGAPSDACILKTQGPDGPDRITYSQYDEVGRLWRVTSGYGASAPNAQRVEKTVTYTANGKEQTVSDGKGNLTTYEYDGLDRLLKVRYPKTAGVGSSDTDYDQYGYDAANNRISWRKRDCTNAQTCTTVSYVYDALNRLIYRDNPKVWSYYDNLGRPTTTYSGDQGQKANSVYYDGLGRAYLEYQYLPSGWTWVKNDYDLAGRRTRLTWPDTFHVDYDYDLTNAVTAVKENGSFVLSAVTYDNLGRRTLLAHANGVHTRYTYDAASRLSSLVHDLPAGQPDQTWAFAYNAAGQVRTRTGWNPAYDAPLAGASRGYEINGLNQATLSGAETLAYDGRGNLTASGAVGYLYDGDNRLLGSPGGASLAYDPVGRLQEEAVPNLATRRLAYDGSDLVSEYDTAGTLLRRYVPGPGADEPLVWYEGASNTDRRWLHADAQGSIVALTNGPGAEVAVRTYDEYGVPSGDDVGVFQYTGQTWLASMGLYHYKARAYSPTLGRFLQTDPTGYDDGLNWYAYVGNDPLNGSDPTGQYDWRNLVTARVITNADGSKTVRSGDLFRAIVPGQVTWDNARTDWANGNKVGAVVNTAAGVGEQVLTVLTAGGSKAVTTAKGAADIAVTSTELSSSQASNVNRFVKKLPANATDTLSLKPLPNGGVAAQGVSAGRVPGSAAVYEKQIDAAGSTVQYTKTTYDPAGNIAHVKDKITGEVIQ